MVHLQISNALFPFHCRCDIRELNSPFVILANVLVFHLMVIYGMNGYSVSASLFFSCKVTLNIGIPKVNNLYCNTGLLITQGSMMVPASR